ncbi:amino acid ABC transporter permease [Mesorhizobium sp. CN2-181]|uniref:amino acid ABC transporter permease n=1 Tax=Mesorhizobium yinganensis TaxID=3157707 RepID=UPI0032B73C04
MNVSLQFFHVWPFLGDLAEGAWLTILLTVNAAGAGLVIAALGAFAILSNVTPTAWIARSYVEAVRNTPFLVQLFFIYFSLPQIGLRLSANEAAVITMVINFSGYTIEILRGGIQAIPIPQWEAGRSIGFSPGQIFLRIILPQAIRNTYSSLTSQFCLLLLGSSVVSAISANDLTAMANYIQSLNFRSFEVYIVTAGIYLVIVAVFKVVFALIWRLFFARWA